MTTSSGPAEAAWEGGEPVDLKTFLPDPGHSLYGSVLRELVRVDLEYTWDRGRPRPLEHYRDSFPELFCDPESLRAIAFEEYRLRREAGEQPTPAEYAHRFGVDVTTWPHPHQDFTEIIDTLQRSYPIVATRMARALSAMPRVGGKCFGFDVLAELGRGAFGRVYLARQGELADRLVVLKFVLKLFGESRTLAQLQHTHIVPIYSVNQAEEFQLICMPFMGTTTLADILRDLRSRPALPDRGGYLLERIETGARQRAVTWGSPQTGSGVSAPSNPRAPLEGLTYVEAILWMAARLADGLAHAHARGIIHRDLKPANILLTDDGLPMLLDFNLSDDAKLLRGASTKQIAGTLRYMAPEQLAGVDAGLPVGDERTDLFSLGLILCELLTGGSPFARPFGPPEKVLADLFAERQKLPDVRRVNPAVSPGTESIIRHCLEPDPSRRYQTARELHEDLQRQLENRPLKYAVDPAIRERLHKWTRRHPRVSSFTSVGVIAAVLLLAVASTFLLRVRHLTRLKAAQEAQENRLKAVAAQHRLRDDLKTIEVLLSSQIHEAEGEQRDEGIARAREILDEYRVLESPAWQETPPVRMLTPEERQQLRDDMGELLVLLAGAEARRGQAELALRLNGLAADCFPAGTVPRALWGQRAQLARSVGLADEAQHCDERAAEASPYSPRDRYLYLLTEYRQQGRLPEALPVLRDASRRQNDNFSVWMILGTCYADLGKPAEALECYDTAAVLWPEAVWPHLFRGMACLDLEDYRQARVAFDEVIRLRPELKPTYYNRALAKFRLGDLPGAQADLTHLLMDPKPPLRAYFLRARVRARQGDRAGAARDQEEGLRGEPRDEQDMTSQGLARQARDPQAALADYERALKLNPRYPAALQNKANVLAESLGRTNEAILALDQILIHYPDDVPARAGRGVYHARLGHRDAAHADARETLRRDTKPLTIYQVAGIYALTSRQNLDDRLEAVRLLASAFSQGVGLDLIDGDRDLDAIRDQDEFRQLVESVRRAKPEADAQRRRVAGTDGTAIAAPR